MNISKAIIVFFILYSGVNAQGGHQSEADKFYEEEMSLDMCRSLDHRFDSAVSECVYCAQGLHYDQDKSQCVGTPDVLGKCFGNDHYHAKTQECMYCALGYSFHEDIRECMVVKADE